MRAASYDFVSTYTAGAPIGDFSTEQVKNEPMLFSCDAWNAECYGSRLTRAFLGALPADWRLADDLVIDSRVHMLMPGWYPCIPGWHHDDVPRSAADGQPNYDDPEYRSEHVMALVNGAVCPTQFAVGSVTLPAVDPAGGPVYGQWHPMIDRAVELGDLVVESAPSNRLVYFDDRAIHQGVVARETGWRWFIRASRHTARKPSNEIRRQVQVYLEKPTLGW